MTARLRGLGPALPDALRGVRIRAVLLAAVLALGLLAVFGRAIQLQVVEQERLTSMARDQYLRTIELAPRRGEIRDRSGGTLASSVEVDSIYVDPAALPPDAAERAAALGRLARAAQLSPDREKRLVARAGKPGNRFTWVRRRASPAVVAEVKKAAVPGVGLVKEPRRFYPQKGLAAHLLGFSGSDGAGLEGIERALDEELKGRPARVAGLRDARGKQILSAESVKVDERTGATVVLTIDRGIQYLAEKALQKTLEKTSAASASAVVLDPRTGEVLALAVTPGFNPNVIPRRDQRQAVRNRAITDAFEPGSTMKTFLLAGALDAGAIQEDQTFDCEKGAWRVGRHTIHDHHGYALLAPPQILQFSSNICSGKIGMAVGGEKVAEIYRRFGFGERTGLELSGEARGVVGRIRSDIDIATASFGQGPVMASPLQLAAALSAVGNGGKLMRPWLVKEIVEPDGTVSHRGEPVAVRQAISPQTSARLSRWLEAVVSREGTAQRASIDGYRVAGKTGTAQKPSPGGGYGSARIASFGGFVPAEDPRLTVLIVVDEPKGEVYGGQVAAPAFREIAEGALKLLGVPPTEPLRTVALRSIEPGRSPKGEANEEARFFARSAVRQSGPAGGGPIAGHASGSEPKAPAAAPEPEQAEGFVVDEDRPEPAVAPKNVAVPDVRGMFARAAVRKLGGQGLEPDVEGSGRVSEQAPAPGTVVPRGGRVVVRLSPL